MIKRGLISLAFTMALSVPFCETLLAQNQTFFDVTNHALVQSAIYSDTSNLSSTPSATGALGLNIDFENGLRSDFFIEQQRRGADWTAAGLLASDQTMIDTGNLINNWGFGQHALDGSFPGTADAVHSTSLFLEGAARASVLLENANITTNTTTWIPQLHATADYMIDPAVVNPGIANNLEPFSHRYFLRAAGVEMTANLLGGDAALSAGAKTLMQDGLALQQANGILPERGGFDFNYQGIGLAYLGRYHQFTNDTALQANIAQSMSDQLGQFSSRVDSLGNIDLSDSTRITSEPSRSGGSKQLDTNGILQGFLYANEITNNQGYLDLANLIANPVTAIVEYDFNDPTSADGLKSSGSDQSSQSTLFAREFVNGVGQADTTPLGAAGSGLTGRSDDYAYDLTSTPAMGVADGSIARTDGGVDSLDGLASFTMSGWYRTDGSQSLGGNIELLKTDTMKLTATDGGFLRLFVDSGASANSVTSTNGDWSQQDEWAFFAVSYDGTATTDNVRFYTGDKTGQVQLSSTQTLNNASVDSGSSRLFVSRQDRPFDGYLDNLRIYGSDTDNSGMLSLEQLEDLRTFDLLAITAVPEPASLTLMAVLCVLALRRNPRESRQSSASIAS